MKYLMISFKLGMVFLILTVENLTAKPLIFQDKNECWVISAKAVVRRDKTEPVKYFFTIPIYKGDGDIVEESELYKIVGTNYKNESLLSFCETKVKGQKREDILIEILNFYKKSLLANKNIFIPDSVDSDGTTAQLIYKINEGNSYGSLTFLIPDSERIDWNSNNLNKLKIKDTNSPIYFDIGIGFRK
ncbi:MAG: hypothetical protein O9275_07040 [Microcystis sp. LE19-196.1B]|nr:hypothetical protein [Microcystis sp. LE19-196.1B]